MMQGPRISVCIPAYNRAALLQPLLDSILSQINSDFEIVISEDASPEQKQIQAIVEFNSNLFPGRISYHQNEINLGYDGNLRRLVELARGDYVIFMGNDDLMAPGALSVLEAALGTYPNVGVVLRSYASFMNSPDELVEKFRYFDRNTFFPAGARTIVTFFRRCVFISGMAVKRESALAISSAKFDGTLLYQQHLVGQILAMENGVYLTEFLSYHRLGGTPDFGNSAVERGRFIPGEQTIESSVHFVRGMLKIALSIEKSTSLSVYSDILKDIGNYSYPILSIQARRTRVQFLKYTLSLAALGLGRVPLFYIYVFGLLIFGKDVCDSLIKKIKLLLGRAPKIGNVYSGGN